MEEFRDCFTEQKGVPNWGLKVPEEYLFRVRLQEGTTPGRVKLGRKSKAKNVHIKKVNEKREAVGLIRKSTSL